MACWAPAWWGCNPASPARNQPIHHALSHATHPLHSANSKQLGRGVLPTPSFGRLALRELENHNCGLPHPPLC